MNTLVYLADKVLNSVKKNDCSEVEGSTPSPIPPVTFLNSGHCKTGDVSGPNAWR